MTSRSCAIKLGSENTAAIRHVVFSNCIIRASNRGVGIQNRDEGSVSDVLFSNMLIESRLFSDVWWGKAEPIYVTAYRRAATGGIDANPRFAPGQTEGQVGPVHDIYFSNLKCQSENGIFVSGETGKISDLYFDQIDMRLDKTTAHPGGLYDRRPTALVGFIEGRTSGFYLYNATRITVRNSSVRWGTHRPAYYAYALESHGVTGLRLENLTGDAAFPLKLAAVKRYPAAVQ